ncbi:hypothetical protein GDO78_019092 [Eleutherodactylus coqui]|uniref:Uncharacterized protein n=1 Tax=Eleutherodactylus coqui TaxID=57060 RepID=A0A8J6BBS5_ELECQ|nr:hypothetical protein GDO78_019092 [Eleutherodactylus coqui]
MRHFGLQQTPPLTPPIPVFTVLVRWKSLVCPMGWPMSCKSFFGGEGLVAPRAGEHLQPRVRQLMCGEGRPVGKRFAAFRT